VSSLGGFRAPFAVRAENDELPTNISELRTTNDEPGTTNHERRTTNVTVKPTILIVDDEPGVRTSLSGVLRDEGYSVDAVPSGEDCLERVTRAAFDLIVLDVWLPGMDGLATAARLRGGPGGGPG